MISYKSIYIPYFFYFPPKAFPLSPKNVMNNAYLTKGRLLFLISLIDKGSIFLLHQYITGSI